MKDLITFDTETLPNYFCLCFIRLKDGKKSHIELKTADATLDDKTRTKIIATFRNNECFGFNSNNFDIPVIQALCKGYTPQEIADLASEIIESRKPAWMTQKDHDFTLELPSFDVMEPAPGVRVGLKLYGARMHFKKLQELPIPPGHFVTKKEMKLLRGYCYNDCEVNIAVFEAIKPHIELRRSMSKEYGMDLRSKSDAQIAEAVIKKKLTEMGVKVTKPKYKGDELFSYVPPFWIKFKSDQLKDVFSFIKKTEFGLKNNGSIDLPPDLTKIVIKIGDSTYKIGVGGLHSQEKRQAVIAKKGEQLVDVDVAAYYPSIILNEEYFPEHLGMEFLDVYGSIVDRRKEAKKTGDKVTDAALKVTINGSYGKLGSIYSVLYAPELLLHVTLTGQLALLMLIERLESKGIKVTSANTDGIICHFKDDQAKTFRKVYRKWEKQSGLVLEETSFSARYARDVNNYLAIKHDNSYKGKGLFVSDTLTKNPTGNVIQKAAAEHIVNGVDIEDYVENANPLDFIMVRKVTGGAIYKGEEIGALIRWVYVTGSDEVITYKKNGNKVPITDGAQPVMNIEDMPENIDYKKYVLAIEKLLTSTGFL